MIKVTENEKYAVCCSCGKERDIKHIKVSRTGQGWTTIMLCQKCIAELVNKLN